MTRRQVLATGVAAAVPIRFGAVQLARKPKVVLELVRNSATNSMRAVERVIWVAK